MTDGRTDKFDGGLFKRVKRGDHGIWMGPSVHKQIMNDDIIKYEENSCNNIKYVFTGEVKAKY